jgi:hypothetical protein
MGMGNRGQQFVGDITCLVTNAGRMPNKTNMISGFPSQGIIESAATKRGDDGKKDGGENLMRSSTLISIK